MDLPRDFDSGPEADLNDCPGEKRQAAVIGNGGLLSGLYGCNGRMLTATE